MSQRRKDAARLVAESLSSPPFHRLSRVPPPSLAAIHISSLSTTSLTCKQRRAQQSVLDLLARHGLTHAPDLQTGPRRLLMRRRLRGVGPLHDHVQIQHM